jgi:hypothetical protein
LATVTYRTTRDQRALKKANVCLQKHEYKRKRLETIYEKLGSFDIEVTIRDYLTTLFRFLPCRWLGHF